MNQHSRASEHIPAVVVGLKENGLGVARDLGRNGVRVIALDDDPSNPNLSSRFCYQKIISDLDGPGLMTTLGEIARAYPQRPVLILTMDRSVLTVSPVSDALSESYRHSLPDDAIVQQLIDKKGICEYAKRHGFKIPVTASVSNLVELESALERLTLPVIIKPQTKAPKQVTRNPGKAFLVSTREAARERYATTYLNDSPVVIQQWIPGPDSNLRFCLYYFDTNGTLLGQFGGRKIRQHKPYTGIACAAEPFDDALAQEMGLKFFRDCRFTGLCAIEFKIDARDQTYYLIEPTVGRSEHLNALASANGALLTLNAYESLAELDVTRPRKHALKVIYLSPNRDTSSALQYIADGVITVPEWIRSLIRVPLLPLWAWDDPLPSLHNFSLYLQQKARGLNRRIRA